MTCPSNPTEETFTVGRLLTAGAAYLSRHGISPEEAQTQAEILLSELLHLSAPGLTLQRDRVLPEADVATLRGQFQRLAHGEPIQYLIGHWPFHDIELKVDPRALIPRPETEELVERILHSPQWPTARAVADIGTGTGAILLSLAHARRKRPDLPPCTFTAIDLSPDALSLAKENAAALGLSDAVTFLQGDGLAPLEPASQDILVSNPPYIATKVVDALPSLILDHEPRLALDGGPDGLDILRGLILNATQVLRPNGRLFMEIGDEQGLSMQRLLDRAGYTQVTIAKDFAGHDRYAEGTLP